MHWSYDALNLELSRRYKDTF